MTGNRTTMNTIMDNKAYCLNSNSNSNKNHENIVGTEERKIILITMTM